MNRARTLATGAAALLLLSALAAGIPWALARFVGWPLPHRLPTWIQFTTALSQHGIPDDTLIKALTCVVWIAWAVLVMSLAVEGSAVIRGGTARRVSIRPTDDVLPENPGVARADAGQSVGVYHGHRSGRHRGAG